MTREFVMMPEFDSRRIGSAIRGTNGLRKVRVTLLEQNRQHAAVAAVL